MQLAGTSSLGRKFVMSRADGMAQAVGLTLLSHLTRYPRHFMRRMYSCLLKSKTDLQKPSLKQRFARWTVCWCDAAARIRKPEVFAVPMFVRELPYINQRMLIRVVVLSSMITGLKGGIRSGRYKILKYMFDLDESVRASTHCDTPWENRPGNLCYSPRRRPWRFIFCAIVLIVAISPACSVVLVIYDNSEKTHDWLDKIKPSWTDKLPSLSQLMQQFRPLLQTDNKWSRPNNKDESGAITR